jgi:carbon-monoxide dehydrogenase iron sulfur subunit
VACRAWEIACALAHSQSKDLVAATKEKPRPGPRLRVVPVEDRTLTVQCRHCDNPPCVAVCPVGAMAKEGLDAPVILDLETCIGCRLCLIVCPFGSVTLNADGKAVLKCDLCRERAALGLPPACVEACPTEALSQAEARTVVVTEPRSAALATFEIHEDTCTGCHRCGRTCPAGAIEGKAKEKHRIIAEKCVRCGQCHEVCRFDAVLVQSEIGGADQANCEACGAPFALLAVLESAVAKIGAEPERLYTCPECRRKQLATESVAAGDEAGVLVP